MYIEQKIKDIRISKGFTIDYLAEKAGLDKNLCIEIESGNHDITFKQLEKVAAALEYDVVDIISHQESVKEIRNYFYNHSGNSGININVQGINQEEIRKAYKELYTEELARIPKLEKLLRDNNIDF